MRDARLTRDGGLQSAVSRVRRFGKRHSLEGRAMAVLNSALVAAASGRRTSFENAIRRRPEAAATEEIFCDRVCSRSPSESSA